MSASRIRSFSHISEGHIRYRVLQIMTQGFKQELEWMRNSDHFTLDDIVRSIDAHKAAVKAMQEYEKRTFGAVVTELDLG